MRATDINLKEVLVRNLSLGQNWIEFHSIISVNNTNQTVSTRVDLDLPQEMNMKFFKALRTSQEKPTPSYTNDPSEFIQVIRVQDYESMEKKMLNFFRTIWQNLHQSKNHRSLTPRESQVDEIRNLRIRL